MSLQPDFRIIDFEKMILIFGGTTEGRIAVDVCEEAGKPFYYSTKGATQKVDLVNGVRLSGSMRSDDIVAFCHQNNIHCIVDAAHPFAENLHNTIAETGLPVVRLQRQFGKRIDGVIYCKDYDEAIAKMEESGVEKLLALSGVNTIVKLKSFWQTHHTIFRILNREESIEIVNSNKFPLSDIIFYPDGIPGIDDEKRMMAEVGCDAIITKESGETGGFESKVNAALDLGLKVFVVEHPHLPDDWIYVNGRHTLRRAIQHLVSDFFPLKTGLTTGACATAATKAALLSLLTGECPEEVSFALPDGEILTIPVESVHPGIATAVKDFSDDPDVLKGCRITSVVTPNQTGEIRFLQGEGVGVVTLPGLGIPVGEPAVNPTPRRMITNEIRDISDGGYDVKISVEDGAELAIRTFNYKVGVVDGVSIIGTSGIVSPLSNEAFVESIGRELEVAKAIGCTEIGFASGKKGENALKEAVPSLRVIHYGNFIGEALKKADKLGFRRVILGIMIGKAIKLADGHLNTHSHIVAADLSKYGVTMARQLWDVMPPDFFKEIENRCLHHCRTVFPNGELSVRLIKDTN